jgi:hypothetical protein
VLSSTPARGAAACDGQGARTAAAAASMFSRSFCSICTSASRCFVSAGARSSAQTHGAGQTRAEDGVVGCGHVSRLTDFDACRWKQFRRQKARTWIERLRLRLCARAPRREARKRTAAAGQERRRELRAELALRRRE